MTRAFSYYRVTAPKGLVAVEAAPGAMRAVVYRPSRDLAWRFNPVLAARLTLDDRYDDEVESVDRAGAEQWCRTVLGTELPAEAELHDICEAGDAARNARRWQQSLLRQYGRATTTLGEASDDPAQPEGRETTFYAIYTRPEDTQPVTLIVIEPWRWSEGMRAVSWEPAQRAWIFDPDRSRDFLQDSHLADVKEVVDRETATRFAKALGTSLPDDDEIHRISEQGLATRQAPTNPTPPR